MESSGEYDDYESMSQEFAKRHVIAALIAASENIKNDSYYDSDSKDHYDSVLKPKILNSYPLTNIK